MTEKMTDIAVELATMDDGPSLVALLHESFFEYQESYTPEGFAATTPTVEQIQTRMKEGPIWVVGRDAVIVGTVSVVSRGESLYIRGMAVLPQARGQNIGNALLQKVEEFASERGFKRLVLSTTPFLSRAIRLYEQAGFSRSNEGPHDLYGTPLFTMEKTLE